MPVGRRTLTLLAVVIAAFGVMAARPSPLDVPGDRLSPPSLRGKLLVAATSMPANVFRESVILMIEHDANGAMGVIVNKPTSRLAKARLFDRLGLPQDHGTGEIDIFYGGPVERRIGLVIHDGTFRGDGTQPVADGIAVSPERPVIEAMAVGKGPKKYLFATGYAGWAPGQLEAEMKRGDWVTAPADQDIVFGGAHDTKWRRASERRYRTL